MSSETPGETSGDAPAKTGPSDDILLVAIDGSYYLAMGDQYLDQIMIVDGDFPSPITCLKFRDLLHLNIFSNGKATIADLWAINPIIIERLRKDQHLLESDVP